MPVEPRMLGYRQADLDQARELAPRLSSKRQERIALALAERERKGADKHDREQAARLVHDRGEVASG